MSPRTLIDYVFVPRYSCFPCNRIKYPCPCSHVLLPSPTCSLHPTLPALGLAPRMLQTSGKRAARTRPCRSARCGLAGLPWQVAALQEDSSSPQWLCSAWVWNVKTLGDDGGARSPTALRGQQDISTRCLKPLTRWRCLLPQKGLILEPSVFPSPRFCHHQ